MARRCLKCGSKDLLDQGRLGVGDILRGVTYHERMISSQDTCLVLCLAGSCSACDTNQVSSELMTEGHDEMRHLHPCEFPFPLERK